MIYTAGSISLAILEMLVHIQSTDVLSHYVTFELSLDGALVDRPAAGDLPSNWFRSPAPAATRNLGDAWIRRGQSPVLEVPSAIVRTEWNYLINPDHPDFARIAVAPPRPITLDRRLG
jgi:RES domain-containing protein